MKTILLVLIFSFFTFAGLKFYYISKKELPAHEQGKKVVTQRGNLQTIITNQVRKTIKMYKKEGMLGLKLLSLNCYKEFKKSPKLLNLTQCLSIDITANKIDEHISSSVGFPKEDYFHSILIDIRLSKAKDLLPAIKNQDASKLRAFITPHVINALSK